MDFSLDLKLAEAAKDLRKQEEIKMLGPEVKVSFTLPSGETFDKKFRMGNLVEHLKVEVQSKSDIAFRDQELYLGEKLMADPLMLRDLWKDAKEEMKVTVKQLKPSKKKGVHAVKPETKKDVSGATEDPEEEYAESTDEDAAERTVKNKEETQKS